MKIAVSKHPTILCASFIFLYNISIFCNDLLIISILYLPMIKERMFCPYDVVTQRGLRDRAEVHMLNVREDTDVV